MSMQCPACGYLMSDLDNECPRCQGFEAQPGTSPPTPEPPPVSEGFEAQPGTSPPTPEPPPVSGGSANSDYEPFPAPRQISGMAFASVVFGLCGFLTCGLSAVVGLILGIVSLGQIRSSNGRVPGQGMAIAGIAVSAGMLVLSVALFWA